jgi:hypothetical protein
VQGQVETDSGNVPGNNEWQRVILAELYAKGLVRADRQDRWNLAFRTWPVRTAIRIYLPYTTERESSPRLPQWRPNCSCKCVRTLRSNRRRNTELHQTLFDVQPLRLRHGACIIQRRHNNNWGFSDSRIPPDFAKSRKTVHFGHQQIEQHQVNHFSFQDLQALLRRSSRQVSLIASVLWPYGGCPFRCWN